MLANRAGVPAGYLHPAYAASLAEFGTARALARSGGWLLVRQIPGHDNSDAMSCYPLLCCTNWQGLRDDLADLRGQIVCVGVVTDPFGDVTPAELRQTFNHVARPFKEHFVVDLREPPETFVSTHNRRNARKAATRVETAVASDATALLDDWTRLYDTLIARHRLQGLHRFSRTAFHAQLRVPGCVAMTARLDGRVAGMLLWYVQGEVGYYHLGAYSDEGYDAGASFALFHGALRHFAESGLRWLDLGAGAGVTSDTDDGLSRFKRGWSTGQRTAYFCGHVLDPDRYAALSAGQPESVFFPRYRQATVGKGPL